MREVEDKLAGEIRNRVSLDKQIELVTNCISDYDAGFLVPVLRTLQFLRDNLEVVKQAIRNKGNGSGSKNNG